MLFVEYFQTLDYFKTILARIKMTISDILSLKEKEDHVEFKEATNTYSFEGGGKTDYKKRRKCVLGYVVALANEGGGKLIFGIREGSPQNIVVGSVYGRGEEGEIQQRIYEKLKIRVNTDVLFDDNSKRVFIIQIPSRPIGKVYKFEDTPLMRIGDQLLGMSDEEYFKAVSEQEPDFSATVCKGLIIDDLSSVAIENMKIAYSKKQKNINFLTQSDKQVLIDLELFVGTELTYAALILLGESKAIRKFLPQSAIHLEYRSKIGQIVFDKRVMFQGGYFLDIDKLWNTIDSRNGFFPVQEGPYIFDIPFFNQEVIREAINNAVAHRDYRLNGEILIKQYPNHLEIINPGGFPKGVNLKNLLTVVSTPRNRRLAEVLAKTGTVERSGQGVDKIYFQSLSEAKGEPDYSQSDDFQVELHLRGVVQDKAFALFINKIQKEKPSEERLSVQEIIVLEKVRKQEDKKLIDKQILSKLIKEGYIEKIGKTSNQKYRLSKSYYDFTNKRGEYSANTPLDGRQIGFMVASYFEKFSKAKMSDFVQLFESHFTREQTKSIIYKMLEVGFLESTGKGSGTKYIMGKEIEEKQQVLARALQLGMEQMIKLGEMKRLDKDEEF